MKNETTSKHGNILRGALLRALLVLLASICHLPQTAAAQTPEDFGYGRFQINGKQALGARPLLVLLSEHTELPPLAHSRDYYDNLIFNYFAKDENGNAINNLNGYFLVNSNGRFYWSRAGAGTMGPFSFTGADLNDNFQQPRQALALKAAADAGFNFAEYDDNGDGHITNDELCVLVIENIGSDGAANRGTDPGCVRPEGSSVDVCLSIAIAGHEASLMSMAHELSHSLGTLDLYGADGNQNYRYSLMGSTIYQRPDVMETFQLDPWHKLQFGWVEPKIYSIDSPGAETLGAAELTEGDQPVILYSPARGPNEYYLLEYRTEGAGYDANVPGSGLVIWHVKTDANKVPVILPSLTKAGGTDLAVFINGAPNFKRGGGDPWPSSDGLIATTSSGLTGVVPYALKWLDGLGGNMKVKAGHTLDNGNRLRISWDNYNTSEPLKISRKILYYNATDGSGAVGVIDAQNNHVTLASYDPGAFSQWTHIVGNSSELFYYNARTGAAALGYVDAVGTHHTTQSFPAGSFGAGWTHIVRHKGYLFFYCATNGVAAIGQFGTNGFRQFTTYSAGTFGLGWTSILSTQNGLLFYRAADGAGAVGDWEYIYSGAPGQFASITGVRFKQIKGYGPGSFTKGWTHVVETSNGVLFYRASDGLQVMTDVTATGAVNTRSNTVKTLRRGWTHIVSVNDDILFYDAASGDAAVGEIMKYSPWVVLSRVGSLVINKEFPGYFSPGWTHLTGTVDPTLLH